MSTSLPHRTSSSLTKDREADPPTRLQPRRKSSSFVKNPDVVAHPELANRRYDQWRRFSRDPYMPALDDKSGSKQPEERSSSDYPRRVRYPGSGWTHLFYDLAWTATFANLSQNGEFNEPMDYVSYFAFFAAVLWLWASQTLYSVNFYTNDWFHLISIFIQLIIFGGLAATTKGYEVSAYISHLPGADDFSSIASDGTDGQGELGRFTAGRTYLLSAQTMALAFALTRFIHLVQYLRACSYAWWGNGAGARGYQPWGRFMLDFVHPHILAVVVGLIFSNMMFFAVVGILFSRLKTTLLGTSLKLGFWIGGFTLEVCSHLWYPILHRVGYFPDLEPGTVKQPTIPTGSADDTNEKKDVNPLPLVGVNLSQRLDTITTIILGEGINGFAGTLTSILTAPGVGRLIGANVISAAFIIWFIAYLYFEGPTVLNPKGEGLRRLVWMVTYLPFLSSIFLLLVGIKNQFILTSTISTVDKTFVDFMALLDQEGFFNLANITNPAIPLNPVLKDFLFARGMIWFDEYHLLMDKANLENKTEWVGKVTAWVMRLSFTMIITSYKTFNKQADIPQEVELRINKYNEDDSLPIQDFALNVKGDRVNMEFYQILTEMLHGSIEGARYILIFAGGILICLGIISIIHSSPRDRYQWGVIISRILMGSILALLLLLNLGKYQQFYVSPSLKSQRARVFNWLEAGWILPTIALAYGIQFLVEFALAFFAKRATVKAKDAQRQTRAEAGDLAMGEGGTGVSKHISPDLPGLSPTTLPPPFLDEKGRWTSEITEI